MESVFNFEHEDINYPIFSYYNSNILGIILFLGPAFISFKL